MFTQLIASRPADRRTASQKHALALSLLLHGSVIAAAVLATTQVESVIRPADKPPSIIFVPTRPEPVPAAPTTRPTAPAVPSEPSPLPLAPVDLPISAPAEVPVGLPEPSTSAPEPVFTGGGTAVGTAGDGAPGVPSVADHRVYEGEQVDVPAELLKRSPLPRYPDGLRGLAIEGGARVRFVVDTLGRVETSSFEVLEATHPAFAMSVRATLPRMRFRAARVGARPVRQLVEFPITFRLDGKP